MRFRSASLIRLALSVFVIYLVLTQVGLGVASPVSPLSEFVLPLLPSILASPMGTARMRMMSPTDIDGILNSFSPSYSIQEYHKPVTKFFSSFPGPPGMLNTQYVAFGVRH